jgi:hypothetical protein
MHRPWTPYVSRGTLVTGVHVVGMGVVVGDISDPRHLVDVTEEDPNWHSGSSPHDVGMVFRLPGLVGIVMGVAAHSVMILHRRPCEGVEMAVIDRRSPRIVVDVLSLRIFSSLLHAMRLLISAS